MFKSKLILITLAMFIVGMIGGVFSEQIFWPYFIERPIMEQYQISERPIYVTEEKSFYIQENEALKDSIEKVKKTIIGVKTKTVSGKIIEGTGFALSSDGLIITLAELIPQGSTFSFYVEGETVSYQVLKRDLSKNLALVKLDSKNFSSVGFADLNNVSSGERVFSLGVDFDDSVEYLADEGVVRRIKENSIETNINDEGFVGSPLFNIKGEFLGINVTSINDLLTVIPVNVIKEFTGF
jgi:S1-C subfamily serine protease